ncbi:MAG: hypothetical protein A2284_03460 [Deltaproteobacteria bacterium RIFOXYA12_FULL_61_11]|nr:MAG: hypothetical protein A2284_03460 [Deltaproteobacteria bacterium RIFOXYA12_FULL_61_11]
MIRTEVASQCEGPYLLIHTPQPAEQNLDPKGQPHPFNRDTRTNYHPSPISPRLPRLICQLPTLSHRERGNDCK